MPDFFAGTNNANQNGQQVAVAASGGRRAQSFTNQPLPNYNLATYMIQIRDSQDAGTALYSYTFPLSPENVRKEYSELTNYYDVAGDASNLGVQRIVDIYGQTAPTYILEGTTGWQLHGTDGFQYTGLQSIAQIEGLLATYAQLNQGRMADGNAHLYELWFFDFFRSEFWACVPFGPQGTRQNVARSLLVNYQFRLLGIRNLGNAEAQTTPDPLATQLSSSDQEASQSLQGFNADVQVGYLEISAPTS